MDPVVTPIANPRHQQRLAVVGVVGLNGSDGSAVFAGGGAYDLSGRHGAVEQLSGFEVDPALFFGEDSLGDVFAGARTEAGETFPMESDLDAHWLPALFARLFDALQGCLAAGAGGYAKLLHPVVNGLGQALGFGSDLCHGQPTIHVGVLKPLAVLVDFHTCSLAASAQY